MILTQAEELIMPRASDPRGGPGAATVTRTAAPAETGPGPTVTSLSVTGQRP